MKRGKKKNAKIKNSNKKAKRAKGKLETTPCPNCGYKFRHLHGGKCPMCSHCSSCGEKLHSCRCHEGE